jgi:tRNA-dihydrouridine synthase B
MSPVDPLRIGPLELASPVLSAPIAGFTDLIFRSILRDLGGCGLINTEMINAGGWIDGSMPPGRLRGVDNEPRPLSVQLWDREPALIEEAARRLSGMKVSVIDLNFGCPKKRIMGKHAAGATLLRDPASVGRIVAAAVRGAAGVPVTAKIRLGASLEMPTAPEVARSAEANGAAAVTVHGRTADQHYGVPCHLGKIAAVVRAVSIPVIANGDIHDAASAVRTMAATGAAGVMVAREALTRPWVFREIAAALRGEGLPLPPTLAEQRDLLLRHHAGMVELQGDHWGTVLMRKFAVRYLAGVPGARPFRDRIARADSAEEFRDTVASMSLNEDRVQMRAAARYGGAARRTDPHPFVPPRL